MNGSKNDRNEILDHEMKFFELLIILIETYLNAINKIIKYSI